MTVAVSPDGWCATDAASCGHSSCEAAANPESLFGNRDAYLTVTVTPEI